MTKVGAMTRSVALALTLKAGAYGCTLEGDIGAWRAPDAELAADASVAADASFADAPHDAWTAPAPDGLDASDDTGVQTGDLTVIFGQVTSYFADGAPLPAGDYTLLYVDGCWGAVGFAWTVNLNGAGYWLVGGQPEQRIIMAPGTTATAPGAASAVGSFVPAGAYATYDECVAANIGQSGVTFHFGGGPLGLTLDSLDTLIPPFIMLEGGENEGGRSPTFRLSKN